MKKMGRYVLFIFMFLSCFVVFSSKVSASIEKVTNIWDEIGDFDVITFEEQYFDKANTDDRYNYKFTYDYTILDTLGTDESYIYDKGSAITYYYGISFNESNPQIEYVDIQGSLWDTIVDQVVIYKYNFVNYEFEEIFRAEKNSSGSYDIESPGIYKLDSLISSASGRVVYLIYEPATVELKFSQEDSISVEKKDNAAEITINLDVIDLDDRTTCRSGIVVSLGETNHSISEEKCSLTKVNSSNGSFVGNYSMVIKFSDSQLFRTNSELKIEYNEKTVAQNINYDLKIPEKIYIKYQNPELKMDEFFISGDYLDVTIPAIVDVSIEVLDDSSISSAYIRNAGEDTIIQACRISTKALEDESLEFFVECRISDGQGLKSNIEFVIVDDFGNSLVIEQNITFDDILLPDGENLLDYLVVEDNKAMLDFQGGDDYGINKLCIFYGQDLTRGYECGFPIVESSYYYTGDVTIVALDEAYNFKTHLLENVEFLNGYDKDNFTTTGIVGNETNRVGLTSDIEGLLDIACGNDKNCKSSSVVSIKYGDYIEPLGEENQLPSYLDILNKKFKDSTCASKTCDKEVEMIINYKIGDVNQSISRYYQYVDELPTITGSATYPSNALVKLEYGSFDINSSDVNQALYGDELRVNLFTKNGDTYIGIGKISPVFVEYKDRNGNVTLLDNLSYLSISSANGFGYYTLECRVEVISNTSGVTYTEPYAKSFFVTVELQDTIAPVITLLGETEVTIKQYGAYKDEGYKCNDLSECSVNVEYFLNDESNPVMGIDTKVTGKYIVKYNAVDGDGNHSITAIRIVNVDGINNLDTNSIIAIVVIIVVFGAIVTIGIIIEVKKNKKIKEKEE